MINIDQNLKNSSLIADLIKMAICNNTLNVKYKVKSISYGEFQESLYLPQIK